MFPNSVHSKLVSVERTLKNSISILMKPPREIGNQNPSKDTLTTDKQPLNCCVN